MVAAFAVLFALVGASTAACGSTGIQCGDAVCDLCCNAGECRETEAGCFDGAANAGRIILRCDGPEDCVAGQTCCAGIPGGSFAIIAECSTVASCAGLPSPQYLCHDDEDCRPGERCAASAFGIDLLACQ